MPVPNADPPPSVLRPCRAPCPAPLGGLRPELAAFFALASREYAPRRLTIEHGVLAELQARRGID